MSELGRILKKFAEDRRDLMEGAKKDARKMGGRNWHFVGRGIELIAINEKGERDDYLGGPEFIEVKELTQQRLKDTAAHWGRYYRGETELELAKIGLQYGLDVYDSFADYMADQRGDIFSNYTIWEEWAEAEIPVELLGY